MADLNSLSPLTTPIPPSYLYAANRSHYPALAEMTTQNTTAADYPVNSTLEADYVCYFINGTSMVITSNHVSTWMAVVLIVVGLIGNMLSVTVFSSAEMRIISSNFYLLMLAVSDSCYLISVFMTKILTALRCLYFYDTAADIVNRETYLCKIFQYLLDLFSDYSTCLIMAFTIERFIAVYMPLKFKELCTVHRAKIACGCIFGVVSTLIGPYHFLFIGRPYWMNKTWDICTMLPEHENAFSTIYIFEMLLFRVIPVFIIAVLNVFIISRVSKVTRERKKKLRSVNNSVLANKKRNKREDKSMQLTIMLILVSTTYILVYLPTLVVFVLKKLMHSNMIVVDDNVEITVENYTKVLYISGFAVNFFLYTMSGKVFREQLEIILCHFRDENKNCHHAETNETTTLV